MFLIVGDDGSHVAQKMIENGSAVFRPKLSDGSRQHVLTLARAQYVNKKLLINTTASKSGGEFKGD